MGLLGNGRKACSERNTSTDLGGRYRRRLNESPKAIESLLSRARDAFRQKFETLTSSVEIRKISQRTILWHATTFSADDLFESMASSRAQTPASQQLRDAVLSPTADRRPDTGVRRA